MGLLLDMGLHLLQLDWFGSDWCRCEINGKRWFPLPLVCAISLKTCWEVGRFAGSHRTKSIWMGKDYEFPWVVHAFSTTAVIHLEYLGVTLRMGRTCPLACPHATWLFWDGTFSWSKCCPLGVPYMEHKGLNMAYLKLRCTSQWY